MLAIIAGSGLQRLKDLSDVRRQIVRTPFGEMSCALTLGRLNGVEVAFINRHGYGHTLAPHQINYRANLWALQHVGVTHICAIGSAGSLTTRVAPGDFIVVDDIIDYTHGRHSTFSEGPERPIVYTDMEPLFAPPLRAQLLQACAPFAMTVHDDVVYACTNGPRLETRAEVRRMVSDGAHVVGMTLATEAVLAKELALPYAAITVCTNHAAGVHEESGAQDVSQWRELREASLARVQDVLALWVTQSAQVA